MLDLYDYILERIQIAKRESRILYWIYIASCGMGIAILGIVFGWSLFYQLI